MHKESWDKRIERAERLLSRNGATSELLLFYAKLLRAQKEIYDYLRSCRDWLPSGSLEEDLPVVRTLVPSLLHAVVSSGSSILVEEAQLLLQSEDSHLDQMLLEQWRRPSDLQFFAKAFLQPYARWLAESGAETVDRDLPRKESSCPFCGGNPQLSVIQIKESSSGSGGRDLMCSTCLTVWPYRRVVCANCGEERPAKLGYYHSPDYDHIRVEACESCHHYLKGIDLTLVGLADPLVDEVAGAPLDLWAIERGYTKIELNLVGL